MILDLRQPSMSAENLLFSKRCAPAESFVLSIRIVRVPRSRFRSRLRLVALRATRSWLGFSITQLSGPYNESLFRTPFNASPSRLHRSKYPRLSLTKQRWDIESYLQISRSLVRSSPKYWSTLWARRRFGANETRPSER
jgi:hypothetical protein